MKFQLAATEKIYTVNTNIGWCSVHVKTDRSTKYELVDVYDQDGNEVPNPIYNEVLDELKKQEILTGVLV